MKYKINNEVRFYYSQESNDLNNMIEIVEVTDDMDIIYRDMYRLLSVLEELRSDYDE